MTRRQVTVRTWDPVEGGSALTDDGAVVVLPPDALRHSVFRLLRPGQRVALVVVDEQVTSVELV